MSFQCYFVDNNNQRCKNEQEDCWCSQEHEQAWKVINYQDNRPKQQRQLSIKDIQKRLQEMANKKREERFKIQQQLL